MDELISVISNVRIGKDNGDAINTNRSPSIAKTAIANGLEVGLQATAELKFDWPIAMAPVQPLCKMNGNAIGNGIEDVSLEDAMADVTLMDGRNVGLPLVGIAEEASSVAEPSTSTEVITTGRRRLYRSCKENSNIPGVQTRSIIKRASLRLSGRLGSSSSSSSMKANRIEDNKKFNHNVKPSKFVPTKLETIFEETQSDTEHLENQVNMIGRRKAKRSLTLRDGSTTNRTLTKHRRQRIKMKFGRSFIRKNIPFTEFIRKLMNIEEDIYTQQSTIENEANSDNDKTDSLSLPDISV